jgi:hypothetical protein
VQLSSRAPLVCSVTAGGRISPEAAVMPKGSFAILATARPDRKSAEILAASGALVRASVVGTATANIHVRAAGRAMPDSMHFLCEQLGLHADRAWKPIPLRDDLARARSILSPSTGAPPPYIVAGREALKALERSGAEVPLRVVPAAAGDGEFATAGRAVRAAIVSGAAVVAADAPDLWAEACALGVPVAGLDRSGCFPEWQGSTAARDEKGFLASWKERLRRALGTETPR